MFVGDDWSETHHDIWVMDGEGHQLAYRRLAEGLEGIRAFHDLMAQLAADPSEVVIGTETDRGLWVEALVAGGYRLYAINPKAVARYRERHHLSGAKSDQGDAKLLADLVRTDRHNHRPIAGDSALAEGIKVLERTHQNLIWERQRNVNRLRSALREFYPAAIDTFDELSSSDALATLERAPTPEQGKSLSVTQIKAALKRGGRQRYLDQRAAQIQTGLRATTLRAPAGIEAAFATTVRATVAIIVELNTQIAAVEAELESRFEQHPDAAIYLSMPGLSHVLGARVLGEFGDDPDRYADPKSRRNYAGTSPVTIASGKQQVVTARWIRNNRLYNAVTQWAFCALTNSTGCRAYYDQQIAKHDNHYKALRALANRLVGILHGCLKHHTPYNEKTAWAHRQNTTNTIAA